MLVFGSIRPEIRNYGPFPVTISAVVAVGGAALQPLYSGCSNTR